MKKNKAVIWGLCICLAVSAVCGGCGGGKKKSRRSSVKLETGKMKENSLVIAIGNECVRYSEVLNYAYLLKRQYEGNFTNSLWGYQLDAGRTIGEEAKQEIVNMITQLKIIRAEAKAEDVSLSGDEIDEALQKAERVMENVTEENRKAYSLSVQGLSEIYQDNILANKMFYIATDDVETDLSDELSDEEKEARIQERLMERFKQKYEGWLKKCEVRISEEFWDTFQL